MREAKIFIIYVVAFLAIPSCCFSPANIYIIRTARRSSDCITIMLPCVRYYRSRVALRAYIYTTTSVPRGSRPGFTRSEHHVTLVTNQVEILYFWTISSRKSTGFYPFRAPRHASHKPGGNLVLLDDFRGSRPGFTCSEHPVQRTAHWQYSLLVLDYHGVVHQSSMNESTSSKRGLGLAKKNDNKSKFTRISYEITRKDRLYKNIEGMQRSRGTRNHDFIPQTFLLPNESRELQTAHFRYRGPWIVKPKASSRGRGIYIVNSPEKILTDESVIVAQYINNPLLVDGHKCDLRLYVAVTSYDPLLIYLYEEGLVRFATVKYDGGDQYVWNPCMHLCNYSINKFHVDYVKSEDPDAEDVGHKWTLSALLRHLRSIGQDTELLMQKIEDVIIKSILATASGIVSGIKQFVKHPETCFELFGFDILIDDTLKPWLLEVNLTPSLGCDSPLDVRIKSALMTDLLTLVGVPAVDPIVKQKSTNSNKTINMNLTKRLSIGRGGSR
ncbi:unnamed protein product [Trichogramma brassicae]|uniref:Tubulin--tyrosine ligase-like protein 5 n=1 Tax=Trichogramma brassicae TaxID=86971 RepID=A0A6H5ILS8_9HYME|nr:unnamed protein product [Trichogramma brassicae]